MVGKGEGLDSIEDLLVRGEELIGDAGEPHDFGQSSRVSVPYRRKQPRTFGMVDDPSLQSEEIEDSLFAGWQLES